MPVPPKRENKPPSTIVIAQGANPFPSRRPLCFLCHVLVSPSPPLTYTSPTLSATSCTTSTASLCSSGTQTQRAKSPAACGRFHAVILQEANAYTDCNGLAILLNKDTFETDAAVFPIAESSSRKDTRRHVALVVRGLLQRPSVADSPTVTFCSVHIHNIVAKKPDAAISLLQRLHAHRCSTTPTSSVSTAT